MLQTCVVGSRLWHDAATATLTDWKSWNKLALLLVETAKAHRKLETKEMSVTELELKTLLLRKGENRTVPRTIRTELALSRNLEKEKSIETREAPGQDQGECRDGESTQENAEQAFRLEINCKRRKSRICSHKILSSNQRDDIGWSCVEERESVTGSDRSRCFESITARMFGESWRGRCR